MTDIEWRRRKEVEELNVMLKLSGNKMLFRGLPMTKEDMENQTFSAQAAGRDKR